LLTYIEAGSIAYQRDEQGSAAAVYSHQYRCPVKLVVLPLIAWLQHWQPDAAGPEVIGIAAEITAENKLDLELSVTLPSASPPASTATLAASAPRTYCPSTPCPATAPHRSASFGL